MIERKNIEERRINVKEKKTERNAETKCVECRRNDAQISRDERRTGLEEDKGKRCVNTGVFYMQLRINLTLFFS